ncbi:MAG: aspartyl/asparaginyl beta-hydroxylase domain-containing protein [Pseudomonadota bacterium]
MDKPKSEDQRPQAGLRGAILRFGRRLRPLVNKVIARYSQVGDPAIFAPGTFPWTGELERNWPRIRAEAETVLRYREVLPPLGELSPDHKRIAVGENWKTFFLWAYKYRFSATCARCPETARIVEAIPGLITATFSIMAPHAHVPRHKGVTKGMVTCHLALITPQEREKCRIEIGDTAHVWREGEALVFDDTVKHEVWNDTDEERVVLLLHVARPIRFPGSLVAGFFLWAVRHSPFIQDARVNMALWLKQLEQASEAPEAG